MSESEAIAVIEAGGVVGLPTDTVYGIGVNPWNEEAVGRLFRIKGRPSGKPIGLLAGSIEQVAEIADLSSAAHLSVHWPGALTLVLKPIVMIPDWLGASAANTIGVRVPDHSSLLEILAATGPLAVTSANRSGGAESHSDVEARAVLGADVDFYVPGICPGGEASTVVDATTANVAVLRSGPVTIEP